jgi:DNA polymerase
MGRTPPWADGLVLRADGYETKFYKKGLNLKLLFAI